MKSPRNTIAGNCRALLGVLLLWSGAGLFLAGSEQPPDDAISRSVVVYSDQLDEVATTTDAVSRSVVLLNDLLDEVAETTDAVSRSVVVYNDLLDEASETTDAVSRTVVIYNDILDEQAQTTDAISRTVVLFNDLEGADPDLDGVLTDDGDTEFDPCPTGQTFECDDNCPADPNPDQRDGDADGVGDACQAPRVVSIHPGDNAQGVFIWSRIRVRFSEPINPVGVTTNSFMVTGNGVPIDGSIQVSTDGLSATFSPSAILQSDTVYQVRLSGGIGDLDGTPAGSQSKSLRQFLSSFRTANVTSNRREIEDVAVDVIVGIEANEELGFAVSRVGDLNNDGVGDWMIGAPGFGDDAGNAPADRGRVLLFLGNPDGTIPAQPAVIFEGANANDRAGVSLAGGVDVNRDGTPDLLIGAEQFDGASGTGSGRAYLIYFDPNDYDLTDPTPDVVRLDDPGVADVVFMGKQVGDRAGRSVALTRDVSGDGRGEVLIGAPFAERVLDSETGTPTDFADRGEAYLVYITPGLTGPVALADVESGAAGELPGVVYVGPTAGDQLGFSLDTNEDFDCDGSPDVLLGAPNVDASQSGGGAVYLDATPASRGITEPDKINRNGTFGHRGLQLVGDLPGMRLGHSVSFLGDHDGNSCAELVAGAPGSSLPGMTRPDAGEVLLVGGDELSAFSADLLTSADVRDPLTGLGTVFQGMQAGDELGAAVADGGDIDLDGTSDLLMGAPGFDRDAIETDTGAVYVTLGADASLVRGAVDVTEIGQSIPGVIYVGELQGDRVGFAIDGVGDVNADGSGDFVVGAPGRDTDTMSDAGAAYVITESPAPASTGPPACGPAGCTVVDLDTGSQIVIAPGALSSAVQINVDGILEPGLLPALEPAGQALVGATRFTPELQAFDEPQTVVLATRACFANELTLDQVLPLVVFDGLSWIDAGVQATVVSNPNRPGQLGLEALVSSLGLYAAFAVDTDSNCGSTADRDGDGIPDNIDNCPDVPNPDQLNSDPDPAGDACDLCPQEGINDADGDGICCGASGASGALAGNDNCCLLFNPSQLDRDVDGSGDACDNNPRLFVAQDDSGDYTTIQAAVDAATESGTTIEVASGVYQESVQIERGFAFTLVGVGPSLTVVDGGGQPAFDVIDSAPGVPVRFDNLVIRGAGAGIRAGASIRARFVTVDDVAGVAFELGEGDHVIADSLVQGFVDRGVLFMGGSSLVVSRTRFHGLTEEGIRLVDGTALLENTLVVAGAAAGIIVDAAATASLMHCTIGNNGGTGVDNFGTLTMHASLLWGNSGADGVGLACPNVHWSSIGIGNPSNCAGQNDNDSRDPLFGSDEFALGAGSTAIDFGPDPAQFTGTPCLDASRSPRLRDGNGNGQAPADPGALEFVDATRLPGEVDGVSTDKLASGGAAVRLDWGSEPNAVAYRIVRGDLVNLGYDFYGTTSATTSELSYSDGIVPDSGAGFFYLVAAETATGNAGSYGLGTCAERSDFESAAIAIASNTAAPESNDNPSTAVGLMQPYGVGSTGSAGEVVAESDTRGQKAQQNRTENVVGPVAVEPEASAGGTTLAARNRVVIDLQPHRAVGVAPLPEALGFADLDGDGSDEVLVDRGPLGLWMLETGANWRQLHEADPQHITAGDLDGDGREELVLDLGTRGLWVGNGDAWTQAHERDPEAVLFVNPLAQRTGDIVMDLGDRPQGGLWRYREGVVWPMQARTSPQSLVAGDLDGNGIAELVADFESLGLWVRYNDASWFRLHGKPARALQLGDLDGNGQDEVVLDFGPLNAGGLWVYWNNSTCSQLHDHAVDGFITADVDASGAEELIVDFGASPGGGLWLWSSAQGWSHWLQHDVTLLATGKLRPLVPKDQASFATMGLRLIDAELASPSARPPLGFVGQRDVAYPGGGRPDPWQPEDLLLPSRDGRRGE